MWPTLKLFLSGLFYEAGSPSWTRVVSAILLLAFLVGSGYLILGGHTWGHYDTFATMTAGGGAGLQAFNKFVNSTKNSALGQFPDKGGAV